MRSKNMAAAVVAVLAMSECDDHFARDASNGRADPISCKLCATAFVNSLKELIHIEGFAGRDQIVKINDLRVWVV